MSADTTFSENDHNLSWWPSSPAAAGASHPAHLHESASCLQPLAIPCRLKSPPLFSPCHDSYAVKSSYLLISLGCAEEAERCASGRHL